MTDEVKAWSLSTANLPNLVNKLTELARQGGYVVSAKQRKTKRSLEANNLYWEFVTQFGNHFGYDKDFTHDLLRFKFLYDIVDYDGEESKRLKSTTKLGTKDMAEYFDNCLRYGSENGFVFEDNNILY